LLEISSGLPDDSCEAEEKPAERRLRDLRGRVKAARTAVSSTPGAAEVLRQDGVKAARFYARFEITEEQLRHGVSVSVYDTETAWPSCRAGHDHVEENFKR
jgi:DNA-binding FrmR family transcriptional regulator